MRPTYERVYNGPRRIMTGSRVGGQMTVRTLTRQTAERIPATAPYDKVDDAHMYTTCYGARAMRLLTLLRGTYIEEGDRD